MPTLTITVPLPPSQLGNQSNNLNWRVRRKLVKQSRIDGMASALTAFCKARMAPPLVKAAHVHITAFYKTNARRDADNVLASFKAIFDGFTDAGVWSDDRGVTHAPVTIAKDATHPRAVIVVEWSC